VDELVLRVQRVQEGLRVHAAMVAAALANAAGAQRRYSPGTSSRPRSR
jgi:hypothetical protein